ncbi:MAG TPA: acyl-CoA dehydrogenase [Polyangiaceae bacterium]|nr:acyl-CoA dehydrogenase [Polyangiaceae bacterium]
MSTAQNRYKAPVRELKFLLFEQFPLADLLGKAPYDAWGKDECNMVLDETYKFACEVVGPLNSTGDREGCRLENGHVKTPTGFKEAWKRLYEAGWKGLAADPEYGGQGAPAMLTLAAEEFLSGANPAFNMYSGLAIGAAEVISHFGTPRQKNLYVRNMLGGVWGGTMCLTEPHAGSDVGSARTAAKRLADGKYEITGTKIFISAGDQDFTDNVVHLVLARIDGAPPGTKGLSLFIVPKVRVEDDGSLGGSNDVTVASIEHKMGINGNATCVLNFGDEGKCIGELVGEAENVGMHQMFMLMNTARIGVGLQGVSVGSAAFMAALEYAIDRKQGASMTHWKDATAPRVAIIEHADVRRMLLEMKARTEGPRALVAKLACHTDFVRALKGKDDQAAAYHQGQVDLLVPLVKAYSTDQAYKVCELAIQTFGGHGYLKDHPVEQCARDAKIFSIYEGTNHIQAMDLVGRKLPQNGGANLQAFLGDVAKFVADNEKHEGIGPLVKDLAQAQEAVAGTSMRLLSWFQSGRMQLVPLFANRVLEMMSELCCAWLLTDGARIAHEALKKLPAGEGAAAERAFYEGKVHCATYFVKNILPNAKLTAETLAREDTSALDIPVAGFAQL